MGNLFASASFFGVVAVSVDRSLAIHLHLRYQELVTHKRVVAVVILIWCTAVHSITFGAVETGSPKHQFLLVEVYKKLAAFTSCCGLKEELLTIHTCEDFVGVTVNTWKIKKLRKRFCWVELTPYQDQSLLHGSRNSGRDFVGWNQPLIRTSLCFTDQETQEEILLGGANPLSDQETHEEILLSETNPLSGPVLASRIKKLRKKFCWVEPTPYQVSSYTHLLYKVQDPFSACRQSMFQKTLSFFTFSVGPVFAYRSRNSGRDFLRWSQPLIRTSPCFTDQETQEEILWNQPLIRTSLCFTNQETQEEILLYKVQDIQHMQTVLVPKQVTAFSFFCKQRCFGIFELFPANNSAEMRTHCTMFEHCECYIA
ncbi:hypothetical protein ACROYT_G037911 [Oculina patagonica]